MKREQKEILKLLDDGIVRSAETIADELFRDVVRIITLMRTLAGRRYVRLVDSEGKAEAHKWTITGRGSRFISKFPDLRL